MKKSISKTAISLISILVLAGCGDKTSTSASDKATTSSDAGVTTDNISESTSESSEPETVLPTESLTDAMFAELQAGYSVDYNFYRTYADNSSGSTFNVKANGSDSGFSYEYWYLKDGAYKKTKSENLCIKEGDEGNITYKTSLWLNNTIHYVALTETDDIDQSEYEVVWEYSGYKNVFLNLSASDFTKEDDNTFTLSAAKCTEYTLELETQLYSPEDLYMPSTDVASFKLKTNGDRITGFTLDCVAGTATDGTMVSSNSSGKFTKLGKDCYQPVKTIQGEEKEEFNAILNELKGVNGKQNWEMTQTQSQFNYETENRIELGTMKFKVQDGNKAHWSYYNTNGRKTSDYGYFDYDGTEEEFKNHRQGVIQIRDNYYKDVYVYNGTMADYLPSFDMSSLLFEKDTEASVNGKIVYRLNRDIEISTDNSSTFFTPEEMDSYRDRIICLSVTKDGDTITIRNSTDETGKEESGLILNCEFTNIGKVNDLYTSENLKESAEGLTWTDFLSRNEENYDTVIATYGEENINSIPLLDEGYTNIYVDMESSTSPVFSVYTYDEETNEKLVNEMATKLVDAGFNKYQSGTDSSTKEPIYGYRKNVQISVRGTKKTYSMNVALDTWWNGNKGYEYGLFYITLSLSAAV